MKLSKFRFGAGILLVGTAFFAARGRVSAATSEKSFSGDIYKNVTISFLDHGKPVANQTKPQLIQKLGAQEKSLYEYHEDKRVEYGVIPANEVLDSVYGSAWRKSPRAKLLFTCVDNYKPAISVERFLQFTGYFVVYRKGDPALRLRNRFEGNRQFPIGPLYLTWDRMEDAEVLRDGKTSIPYQIMGINIVDEDYGKLSVSETASDRVVQGARAFENYCSTCHRMNGSPGGERGPDLGRIAIGYQGREGVLAQFIREPRVVHPASTMDPLSAVFKGEPNQIEPTIDLLIDFLKDAAKKPATK